MEIRIRAEGTTPLMSRSDEAAVPGHPVKEAIDRLTSKRKKRTDAEEEELFYLEWLAGFHLDDNKRPSMPTWNIVRSLSDAAARVRQRPEVERSLVPVLGLVPIEHGGPDTLDELWQAGFWDRRMIRNSGGGRVPRCRPKFLTWAVTADFDLDLSGLNLVDVVEYADVAGRLYGLGDGRRLGFGRYRPEVTRR